MISQGDLLVALEIMVIPRKATVVHLTGVVTSEADGTVSLVTEDGTRVPWEFGLGRTLPGPGTVVTIVGRVDRNTGVVRAGAIQRLDDTLQRLGDHLRQINDLVEDKDSQIRHLARVQRMLEKTSGRQLEILNQAVQYLPEESQEAVEKALANLEKANKAVSRAFNQALELAGEKEREQGHFEHPRARDILEETQPSLEDLAEVLGLTGDELLDRLGEGISMVDVAQQVGLTEEDFVDRVLAMVRQRLVRLSEDGGLPLDEVDPIIAEMRKEATYHLGRVFSDAESGPPGIPFSPEDLAPILGLEPSELFARLEAGEFLSRIAEEKGLSRDQLLDKIMELAQTRARKLTEDGAMRQEDVERFLVHLRKEIAEHIDQAWTRRSDYEEEVSVTFEDVAEKLGIALQELKAFLERGGTLEQLARRHGMTLEELVAKALENARQRLERLVEEDRIDPEEVHRILAELKEQLIRHRDPAEPRIVARVEAPPAELRHAPFDFEELARVLDKTPEELRLLLSQKHRLEELAKEKGLTLDDLVARLLAPMAEKIKDMVENDRMGEDQARDMLEKMKMGLVVALQRFEVPGEGERPAHEREAPDPSFRPYGEFPFTLADVARVLGITVPDFVRFMNHEDAFREVLKEHGFTIERFIAAVLELVEARLKESVARADIPEDKIGHMLQELKRRLLHDFGVPQVARPLQTVPATPDRPALEARPVIPFDLAKLAGDLRLSLDELHQLLSDGHTGEEIAKQRNVPLEVLINTLSTPLKEKLEALVKEGRLSKEDALIKLEEGQETIVRRLKEFRAQRLDATQHGEAGPAVSIIGTQQPPSTDVEHVDPATLLPRLASAADVFHILGVGDVASKLRSQGFHLAVVAREVGFDGHDRTYLRLLEVIEARLAGAVRSNTLPSEKAKELLDHFRLQAQKWVAVIFADIDQQAPTAAVTVDPETILPTLASADDVFHILGVGDVASKLRSQGFRLAVVAREVGFDGDDRMYLRLLEVAEARLADAVRSNTVPSEEAKELLDHFRLLALQWVAAIFADVQQAPTAAVTVDPETILPTIASADDVFHILGVGDVASKLRSQGYHLAVVAREVGFDRDDRMYLRLLEVAEARLADAVRSNTVPSEKAKELLDHFRLLAQQWVAAIFADVQQQAPTAAITVDPATILPTIAGADDVFHILGVGDLASKLRSQGYHLAVVAREVGFTHDDRMYLRLLEVAEARLADAVRSNTVPSEKAKELLDHFRLQAQQWVAVIFADVEKTADTAATLSSVTR